MSRLNERFLYKQDSKGKIRQWNGWVEAGQSGRWLMYVETGLLDGNDDYYYSLCCAPHTPRVANS